MGSQLKRWTFFGTKSTQQAANSPIGMAKVQKPLCLIPFRVNPFSHFQPLPFPSFLSLQYKELGYYGRKGKKVDIFWNKINSTGCK